MAAHLKDRPVFRPHTRRGHVDTRKHRQCPRCSNGRTIPDPSGKSAMDRIPCPNCRPDEHDAIVNAR
jgi:hypothetical protein